MRGSSGTEAIFVTGIPGTAAERDLFYQWLREHTEMSPDECRQIALTGEALPCLLSGALTCGDADSAAAQLSAMGVRIVHDRFTSTEEPLETIYLHGRIADRSQTSAFKAAWNEQFPGHEVQLAALAKLRRGVDVMNLGTFSSQEAEQAVQLLARFGLTVLARIDLRDPWLD